MTGEASKIHSSRMNNSKTNLALKATCDGEIRLAPSSIIPLPDAARYVIVMGFEVIILSSSAREKTCKNAPCGLYCNYTPKNVISL